ncbi:unnamed protein product [Cuscuta epithymum]|uniref:Uncharacterized protein n=1 Tax=Cuscuta epithymum TaxID=186058 RepID=A0AAV0CLR5_9ASTE|nr:unnamed protein product [Cuscuta epithymum]CAH9097474.1 unnamed protein product [Cuscuta epithymum]
MERRLRQIGWS